MILTVYLEMLANVEADLLSHKRQKYLYSQMSYCDIATLVSCGLQWATDKDQRAFRRTKERGRRAHVWIDLKHHNRSASSGARAVCGSLKFSLTRTISCSIRDLFITSLMLTQRVLMSELRLSLRRKKSGFLSARCQSVKQTSRQAEISLEPISYLFKEAWALQWRGQSHAGTDTSGFLLGFPSFYRNKKEKKETPTEWGGKA